ncbi:MAG: HPF/RaiA family ribosome-associated protein [Flavobacteriales bacterium]|jgi:ribosome-associated translation inhibitor RaiA|nr:HPF/RaiA family ribosome-associated protein [Flavobacteriales bacterium]MBK6894535.1 HPF/RaiA family ribosome-associated protein [Flavobacteriales bacterium]MBK7248465.1 HPF/RaiA family ribosome-associated protein [Flavobacteriales bacterium]MBK7288555.1 HPF/RaiA family ribosome-associated protein [Flavobacteriales bacterium]MBK9059317.1 HPF/RaiA family ribosome-associated protein [Flavobacteriales bacterium]
METLQILIRTDKNIESSAGLEEHVRNNVNKAMAHFDERLTRVEVHLRDVNGDKFGERDHECMMEARLRGLKPLAVTHADSNLHQAIAGAAERLRNAVANLVGRMEAR